MVQQVNTWQGVARPGLGEGGGGDQRYLQCCTHMHAGPQCVTTAFKHVYSLLKFSIEGVWGWEGRGRTMHGIACRETKAPRYSMQVEPWWA